MATPLDVGLLQHFSIIFPFLLVFVVVYGIMMFSKSFGENRNLVGILALAVAFITILSPTIREIINIMVPWFILVFIFIFLGVVMFKILGATDSDMLGALKSFEGRTILNWFVIISIVIVIGSIASVLGGKGELPFGPVKEGAVVETSGESEGVGSVGPSAFWQTLFHPKILGIALILLIGMMTILKLTVSFPLRR